MADQTGQDDLFLAEPSREGPLKSVAEMGDCAGFADWKRDLIWMWVKMEDLGDHRC